MKDLGTLILRLTVGGLMTGHGAQKLFGAFGGYGLEGTGGWMESLGLTPGKRWATLAGVSEFGGGLLTALGLLNPLGPIAVVSSMATAIGKVHADKPIWVTSGGAELPVINIAAVTGIALSQPDKYSLDQAFNIKVPIWLTLGTAAAATAGVVLSLRSTPPAGPDKEDAGGELIGGEETAHEA